jgi:hypothetical protein
MVKITYCHYNLCLKSEWNDQILLTFNSQGGDISINILRYYKRYLKSFLFVLNNKRGKKKQPKRQVS